LKHVRRLAAIVLASLAVLQGGGSPVQAQAASGVAATGTVSPGIPMLPTDPPVSNNYSFGGTMAGVFETVPGTCNLAFNGTGTDTLLQGTGHGNYTCNGSGINISCTVGFSRTGTVVIVSGTCTGTSAGVTQWVCTAVPLGPLGYALVCVTVIV